MKDEYGGKSILNFVGLKSKMYSILNEKIRKSVQIKDIVNLLSLKNLKIHYLKKRFIDMK